MLCNKCKQATPSAEDTWCLGCSAVESLQVELSAHWHSPGLRKVANEQALAAARAVRALRLASSSLQSAGDNRAALPRRSGASAHREPEPRRSLPPPPAPPAKVETKEVEESSEEEEAEDDTEEEVHPSASAKSKPVQRPPEPAQPPRHRDHSRDRRRREDDHHSTKEEKKSKKRKRHTRGNRAGSKHSRLHRTLDRPETPVHRRLSSSFLDQAPELKR